MYRPLKGHNFTVLDCGDHDFFGASGNFNGNKEISCSLFIHSSFI